MTGRSRRLCSRLLCGTAMAAVMGVAGVAAAEEATFAIPAQSLASALSSFSEQSGRPVLYRPEIASAKVSPGATGAVDPKVALNQLLAGTGLSWKQDGETFLIVRADQVPQGGSAAGGGAEVDALIVTAQKREEDIQDVPIAMSAFSQEDLTTHQIAGGPDLMTQIPNVTFTKTNFSSYSVQIRGIGTQAISATVDPAVAVAFNNTPFLRNRFFEQEFYDLQRIEVLRGPQGTLYGRNATAGVINILSARPKYLFEAKLSGDVANYSSTRLEGMINIPLVDDKVAFRLAGAWTKREGYATNQMTGEQIDGRDLWSARATLGFEPTEAISAYLTYEHFQEDDDRLRSGKQLCKKAETPTEIGGVPVPTNSTSNGGAFGILSYISQGCEAGSLYSDESFQTPNAHALPYYGALYDLGLPVRPTQDPYLSATQSRDLRVIESSIEPRYKADTDILHLQVNIDLTDSLTLTSETAYSRDSVFSTQDYNRFTTTPGAFDPDSFQAEGMREGVLDENGVYCDPQLGCSDRLLAADLSTSDSQQYSQELRLSSDYDGAFNFSVGVNFLRHDALDKYYVFVNTLGMWSAKRFGDFTPPPYVPGVSDNRECVVTPFGGNPDIVYEVGTCIYMDPNPIGALNDLGHNYFLSKNPYRLISYAAFGEIYYNITPALKFTAGLRWTVDKKHAPEIPSWLLAGESIGYPVAGVVDQEWTEPTGRLTLDWQPELGFTDQTLLYASFAHGYKAGGANPPRPVLATYGNIGADEAVQESFTTFPKTFEPEFVDAFEVGTKNTLLDGMLTFNANLFYYDYEGYQISEILNRSAANRNFDAKVWGAELEADWRPFENFKLGFKGGWERTRVADGEQVIDLMDRTAGDPNYMVIKAFPTVPSNCIVPVEYVAEHIQGVSNVCLAYLGTYGGPEAFGLEDVPNNGEGIFKDLGGNELPNAPEFTATITADYTLPLPRDWLLTLHADYYRQSEAWWRIINSDPYDRLEPYQTVNFAAIFTNEDAGWNVMAYVKNVFDDTAITGAFLNSDDSGLTTNVFLTDPRLFGLRVTKKWSGGPLWAASSPRAPGEPYPFTLEVGGGALLMDAPNEAYRPAFVDTFTSPDLPFPMSTQEEDLDWGDTRDVRLVYRPDGSPWSVSGGVRFGRTNGTAAVEYSELSAGGELITPALEPAFPQYADKYVPGAYEFTTSTVTDRERHTIVDFEVGRDIGIGAPTVRSHVRGGLRYAHFESSTDVNLYAGDYFIPPVGVAKYPTTAHMYDGVASIEREFQSAGPTLSWDVAAKLLGDAERGVVTLDASLTGAALFGKQSVDVDALATDSFYSAQFLTFFNQRGIPVSVTPTPIIEQRSERVTVPVLDATLGLSYSLGRVSVGAGYSWERYFDMIDGGLDERQRHDRTLSGPYLRFKLGFGG
jgi:iron complex outermembrane receptor protein